MSLLHRIRHRGPAFDRVNATDALGQIDAGAVLVDVREHSEWDAGRAPQAWHLPMGRLPHDHARLPMDKRLIVVCRSGNRSARACDFLAREGYQVANLEGGMQAWSRAGQPVVAANGRPGRVA